jgi:hypothetical protein
MPAYTATSPDLWLVPWFILFLTILYWVGYKNRGHLVAQVATGLMALCGLMFIFSNYFMSLVGSWQWAIMILAATYVACGFIYWFARKYGQPPQKH